jgi:glycosyltransferase involved in cell wall biosynthesis
MRDKLRVAINAQLKPNTEKGGILDAVSGLISALGKLIDGDEEYVIITPQDTVDWWSQHTAPNQRVVAAPKTMIEIKFHKLGAMRPLASKVRTMLRLATGVPFVPISDGFFENLGCNIIHFPYQQFFVCALPSLFSPYDLQHLHYPEYFTPRAIIHREALYRTGCQLSQTIIVASEWVKKDLIRQYSLTADKIQVVPLAPPTEFFSDTTPESLEAIRTKYHLPAEFMLYPAVTWPHKNHIRLLEAIAKLRNEDNLRVHLICTGFQGGFSEKILARLDDLKLHDQVHFLGFIPKADLQAVYHLAQFIVYPTLFEGAGLPPLEAWHQNKALACSNATCLPELVDDAALLFDPHTVDSISHALKRMATEPKLREELRVKGMARLRVFSWEKTARIHRALYRQAARVTLDDEDRTLLGLDQPLTNAGASSLP